LARRAAVPQILRSRRNVDRRGGGIGHRLIPMDGTRFGANGARDRCRQMLSRWGVELTREPLEVG
jgi:hypothetical protein